MGEARLEDGVPVTAGWFVLNARDARWLHNDMRTVCRFGGEGEARFDDLGVSLYYLEPGKPMSMYHHEARQEDFLILRGEAILLVEGEERPLQAWDFFHCPAGTTHTIVAAGDQPVVVLAVGGRTRESNVDYPVDAVAIRHGAGIPDPSVSPQEAYARFGTPERGPAPPMFD